MFFANSLTWLMGC